MSDVDQETLDFLKPNQYSIRGMLIATAVMAGILTVLGPTLRERSIGTVVLVVAAFLLGLVLWWIVLMLNLAQVRYGQAICGRALLIVERRIRWQAVAERYGSYLFLVFLGAFFFSMLLFADDGSLGSFVARGIALVGVAVVIAFLLSLITTEMRRYCVICEHGFFYGVSFYRWREVQGDRWREGIGWAGNWLELHGRRRLLMAFPVNEKHVGAIEKVLATVRPRFYGNNGSSTAAVAASKK